LKHKKLVVLFWICLTAAGAFASLSVGGKLTKGLPIPGQPASNWRTALPDPAVWPAVALQFAFRSVEGWMLVSTSCARDGAESPSAETRTADATVCRIMISQPWVSLARKQGHRSVERLFVA